MSHTQRAKSTIALLLAAPLVLVSTGPAQAVDPSGSIEKIAPITAPTNADVPLSYSRDGKHIVWRDGAGQYLWTQGSGVTRLGGTLRGSGAISGNGRYLAFSKKVSEKGRRDIYLSDLSAGTTILVSRSTSGGTGNGNSQRPAISNDGRYVVYSSYADNLVPGDSGRLRASAVYRYDRSTRTTVRVDVSTSGKRADQFSDYPSISDDGRYVAFSSAATNLGAPSPLGGQQVYLRDTIRRVTTLVSASPSGESGDQNSFEPVISGNGSTIAYTSSSDNLVSPGADSRDDVFLWNRLTGKSKLVSTDESGELRSNDSGRASISSDGQWVAYASATLRSVANYCGPGSLGIWRWSRASGTSVRVDQTPSGAAPNDCAGWSAVSADGSQVVIASYASDLVAGDTDGVPDVFRWTATPAAP